MTVNNDNINNREFETIFEFSDDPIYVIGGDGKILRMNNACSRFCGYQKDEIIGKGIVDLKGINFFSSTTVLEALESGMRVSNWEITDTKREVIITATPVYGNDKKVERIVCTIKDMTELLKLKSKLNEAEKAKKQYEMKMTNPIVDVDDQPVILNSEPIKKAFNIGERVAKVDSTVLILGESGVGKNVLARKIHDYSPRFSGPFIEINCGAISETLLESELFGYTSGAFTGAKKEGKKGHIEMASNGTVFLDEIGEMTKSLQVKLLHFLQSKTIMRVGSSSPIKVNVRVIAATNQNIRSMVEKGDFREDLFYRLNVVPIELPPLRERRADIQPLILSFLQTYKNKYQIERDIPAGVMDKLFQYSWPGNVRELQNVVERLVVTSENKEIQLEDLPQTILNEEKHMSDIEEFEAHKILSFYKRYKSTYKAAEALGMSQSTFFRKLRQYRE
ncbi:PAS domain S-box protein [bacterium LRH843]|nr:PAS domain S-box protein [bacterium LRH843]